MLTRTASSRKLNPVSKLALVFALSTAAFVFGGPRFIAVPLLFALGATLSSGGARNVRHIGVVFVSLFVFGLVIWSLYADPSGPVIVSLGQFTVTSGQAVFALGRSERVATFLLAGIMYITTTSDEEIIRQVLADCLYRLLQSASESLSTEESDTDRSSPAEGINLAVPSGWIRPDRFMARLHKPHARVCPSIQ